MDPSEPPLSETESRFLFYSHDGMGLGHTRRNLAIASALIELCPQAVVLVATSTDDAHRLGLPARVEVLKLPGLRKSSNDEYASRRLPVPNDEIRHLRSSLLEAAVKSFRPGVALVDKHAFGARGEFRIGLEALKAYGGRAVLGLRDILDEPATVRREWSAHGLQEKIAGFYDRVLVYGERAVFDSVAAYELPEAVARRTRFCGYVVNDDMAGPAEPALAEFSRVDRRRPVVLATTGGGEDGFALLQSFIEAATSSPWRGIAITGPMTSPQELSLLRAQAAAAEVVLHTFLPRLPARFDSIDALVCMGGYNTLTEAMSRSVPTVCVPRVVPRTEQLIRARAFAHLGFLRLLHPQDLSAESLRAQLRGALDTPRGRVAERVRAVLSFDGAEVAARELLALAALRPPAPRDLTDVSY